jgi:predicted phage tail protein
MASLDLSATYVIPTRLTLDGTYVIEAPALSAPQNVFTRNVGNGAMDVQWGSPATGVPGWYEVWISTSVGGTYVRAVEKCRLKWAMVAGLNFGSTIYTKVRAVDKAGVAGAWSAVAHDAECVPAVMNLLCSGLVGDVVPDGARFSAVRNGSVLVFEVPTGGTLT